MLNYLVVPVWWYTFPQIPAYVPCEISAENCRNILVTWSSFEWFRVDVLVIMLLSSDMRVKCSRQKHLSERVVSTVPALRLKGRTATSTSLFKPNQHPAFVRSSQTKTPIAVQARRIRPERSPSKIPTRDLHPRSLQWFRGAKRR